MLKSLHINFIGNVEGRDVYAGNVDVIVCDGFTGNVALKVSEGLVDMFKKLLRESLESTLSGKIGYALSKSALSSFRKRLDHSEYGGAPLLGVRGGCIIGHGSSNANAIKNAIRVAAEFSGGNVNRQIEENSSASTKPATDYTLYPLQFYMRINWRRSSSAPRLWAADWKPADNFTTPWTARSPRHALPEYPRPQSCARWTNLNGLWDYHPSKSEDRPRSSRATPEPIPVESASRRKARPPDQRLCIGTFTLPRGTRLLLTSDGDWRAEVAVNGKPSASTTAARRVLRHHDALKPGQRGGGIRLGFTDSAATAGKEC
jgi:hypothetical protein